MRTAPQTPYLWVPEAAAYCEITSEIADAKYLSKLDASQGFWQLKLHEDSTKYCTFNTPYGRYSFQRLPFGICPEPLAYASRTMTTTECRYAQIERECLGLVYGFQKFTAETDHKPTSHWEKPQWDVTMHSKTDDEATTLWFWLDIHTSQTHSASRCSVEANNTEKRTGWVLHRNRHHATYVDLITQSLPVSYMKSK